jgi:hypothetical protein
VASIQQSDREDVQILLDLAFLEQLRDDGDAEPLRTYLTNGDILTGGRPRENAVFREALAALGR